MRFIQLLSFVLLAAVSFAQTPVPMASQPSLTYSENFADIANWTNNFASGTGANRFGAVAINATGVIPSGARITTSTATFQAPVPPATVSNSGGLHRGSDQLTPTTSIILLSTGTGNNTSSAAFDLF